MLIFEDELAKQGVDWVKLIEYFCGLSELNEEYIYELFEGNNEILLYSMGSHEIQNCPCGLIYQVEEIDGAVNIYIMFIATQSRLRNVGYASIFMREFIDYMKEKYKTVTFILDSVESAVSFYEHFGFKWTLDNKYDEVFNINKDNMHEHIIMLYVCQSENENESESESESATCAS